MKIVITGSKASGKSTVGKKLADRLGLPFIETDGHLEELYFSETGARRTCREICSLEGESSFRAREKAAVRDLAERDWCVIATGGGSMLDPESRESLLGGAISILLKAPVHLLWERLQSTGLPPFLSCTDGLREYEERVQRLHEAVEHRCDIVFTVTADNQDSATKPCLKEFPSSCSPVCTHPAPSVKSSALRPSGKATVPRWAQCSTAYPRIYPFPRKTFSGKWTGEGRVRAPSAPRETRKTAYISSPEYSTA